MEETSVNFFGDYFDFQNDNVYERGGSISHDFLLIRRLEIIFFNYVDVC
jgi:hypothetical protein